MGRSHRLICRDISYGIGSCHETSCLIKSTGNITCIEPCSYSAHCKANFNLWPYDKQNCSMSFGPWMNNEDELDYVSDSAVVTLSSSSHHTEWRLISTGVSKKVYDIKTQDKKYNTRFPNLIYYFVIERHSALITKTIGCKLLQLIRSQWKKIDLFTARNWFSICFLYSVVHSSDVYKHFGGFRRKWAQWTSFIVSLQYFTSFSNYSSNFLDSSTWKHRAINLWEMSTK